MLVIKREAGESFFIGENIEIIIESIDSGQVKVCIDAPRSLTIIRSEMLPSADGTRTRREDITNMLKSKMK